MRRYAYILFVSIIFSANSFAESTAKTTYMVPMRDGVKLATDVYRPLDLSPHPVLLYRTRYNKNNNPLAGLITLLNLRGYVGVIQDTRGRYASGGVDSVFITDGWGTLQDGYDTIEWLTHQSWCNDQIGMLGASADGISTYRAVGSLHPALKCAVAMVAPTDFYHQVVYPGGEYRKSLCEGYLSEQNTAWMIDYYLQNPYYNQIWQDMNWHTRTDSIKIPMLHIGGWYDSFSEGTVAAFQDLLQKLHAASQHLIMGPWTHGTIGSDGAVGEMHYPDAGLDIYNHIIQWFDHWLLGYDNGVDHAPPVHYYLMGDPDKPGETGCGWMETETWPPSDTTILSLYLTVDGKLQHQPGLIGRRSFTYDPDHPVPTLGGNNLTIPAGPFDQSHLTARSDVLSFVSDELQQPLRVEGCVQGHLFVSSDAPDTDFSLKLMDVFPDGRQMLVTDGIARMRFRNGYTAEADSFLQPGKMVPISITLPPTAIVFNSGHRIMIAVSSSNYNRFEVNPNNALAVNDRTQRRLAVNTVHFGAPSASKISLPVVQSQTSIRPVALGPSEFKVATAYPNPFNQSTCIDYFLLHAGSVTIQVMNIRGQVVRTLYRTRQDEGPHQVLWDGMNDTGTTLASGVYYLLILTKTSRISVKLCLLR